MTHPPVSVVVVSRGRPDALSLCLTGLAQLRYPAFEVVVVADPDGISAAAAAPSAALLKLVPFDAPNISAARNAGIAVAAGEVVAFIDDDAVPEPTWLSHLIAPFAQPEVGAAGGFVLGRNGLSFQWRGQRLDRFAAGTELPLGEDAVILTPEPGTAIKTEGTNMAVRREALVALGGFDPAYHFFLDETDLNMRLAAAGYATALVPRAQVHHGYAPSGRRRADRAPRDLFDIGASWAVFQRNHLDPAAHAAHWDGQRGHQRRRVLGHMVAGRLEPRDVRRLLAGLDAGYAAGQARALGGGKISAAPPRPFQAMPVRDGAHVVISARPWRASAARAEARAAVKNGAIVTLLLLSPTTLYHRVRFRAEGYWEQTGGQFGRSVRDARLIQWHGFRSRTRIETNRIEKIRTP
ncbi:MAG: glycosyltransferase [Pseudomonadota bacterium]